MITPHDTNNPGNNNENIEIKQSNIYNSIFYKANELNNKSDGTATTFINENNSFQRQESYESLQNLII